MTFNDQFSDKRKHQWHKHDTKRHNLINKVSQRILGSDVWNDLVAWSSSKARAALGMESERRSTTRDH